METKQRVRWQGISGSTLKFLAVVTMLIDHIGLAVLGRMLVCMRQAGEMGPQYYELYYMMRTMREIGRFAFPVYCFMLVEGLEHTRSRWKYAARLGAFALISEIPFDLAFSSQVLEFGFQNVFFTLVIGLVTLIVLDKIHQENLCPGNLQAEALLKTVLTFLAASGGMLLAELLQTDYDWRGVACILILYFLRKRRIWQMLAAYAAFVVLLGELSALPAFLMLALYRGKKGFSGKAFFYGFYPLHLILLYLTCVLMGIAYIPAT